MKFNAGDIICMKEFKYPLGALKVVGTNRRGELVAHSISGGLDVMIPEASLGKFRLVPPEEIEAAPYQAGKFQIAESNQVFDGWSKGDKWQGWEMPHFEFEEAQRVIAWLQGEKAHYDPDRDAFVTAGDDGEELWQARTILIADGSRIKTYGLGAGSWVWESV